VFLEAAGFSELQAFDVNISLSACYIIGGIICWFMFPHVGRSTIYMGGMTFMFFCLIAIGGLGWAHSKDSQLAIGILLVISTLCNMITTGPACYPIVAETPSGRLRYKTIVIGRFVYNLTGIFSNSVTPRMISSLCKFATPLSHSWLQLTVQQHGTGEQRQVSSMPARIFCATSGAGSVCQRPKTAPLVKST
jgi:SP family general alpha glucoside:H+ symporter-like MFS transporter